MAGYKFSGKQTGIVTTATGKVLTSTTGKGTITTSVINKIYDSNGNEIGTVTTKSSAKNPSKTTTNTTKSTTTKGMYGGTQSTTTWNDWYDTQNSDKYAKKKSGVVVNTSKNDYEKAREAARNRYTKNKKQQEVFAGFDVLKNEVPMDIKELQDKMDILFTASGITMQSADPAVADNLKRSRNREAKKILKDTLEALYNVNYYKEGDPGSTTSADKHVSYIKGHFDNVFNLNEYDHIYSLNAWNYILNDLISVNRFNVLPENKPLNRPPVVNNDITSEDFVEWINYAAQWLEDLFHVNGRFTPADKGLAQKSWINDALNTSPLNTELTTAKGNITSLTNDISVIKAMIYDTFIVNYIGDIDRQLDFYNRLKATTVVSYKMLPTFIAQSGAKRLFTSADNLRAGGGSLHKPSITVGSTQYDNLVPIFQKPYASAGDNRTSTEMIADEFFAAINNKNNFTAYVEDPSIGSFTTLTVGTDYGDAPLYFCNVYHYFIRKILKGNTDLDETRTYLVYDKATDPMVDAERRMNFLKDFIDFIRIAQGTV